MAPCLLLTKHSNNRARENFSAPLATAFSLRMNYFLDVGRVGIKKSQEIVIKAFLAGAILSYYRDPVSSDALWERLP